MKARSVLSLLLISIITCWANPDPQRARDYGIPFDGKAGKWNAITDVSGVQVGYTTLIEGEGDLVVGKGPVRTGVTAILPRGLESYQDFCYGATAILNGNGDMTGTIWLKDSGFIEGPIMITDTTSMGVVRDAVYTWGYEHGYLRTDTFDTILPIVAETYSGYLHDLYGQHIKPKHAFEAIESASSGPVEEGNVGSCTPMIGFWHKGGAGTASRVVEINNTSYTVGVWVQLNFGIRRDLIVRGVPVGQYLEEVTLGTPEKDRGSIIVIIATDAPLLPHQLSRIANHGSIGIGRTGGMGRNSSGDIILAFSTANSGASASSTLYSVQALPNDDLDILFDATIYAIEESIINALFAAEPMTGVDNRFVPAIDKELVVRLLEEHQVIQSRD